MKEIIRGLKLIRYGYNLITNIVCSGIIFLVGLLMLILRSLNPMPMELNMGAFYFCLIPIFIVQINCTLLFSQMIGASARRKGLDVIIPGLLISASYIVIYLLIGIYMMVDMSFYPNRQLHGAAEMLSIACLMAIVSLYYSVCYKFFWSSSALFIIGFLGIYAMAGFDTFSNIVAKYLNGSFYIAAIVGFVIVVISAAVSCLIRNLIYRKSMSPWGGGAYLLKKLQY